MYIYIKKWLDFFKLTIILNYVPFLCFNLPHKNSNNIKHTSFVNSLFLSLKNKN